MPEPLSASVEQLLSRYIDGVLTESELAQLDEAIQHQEGVAEQAAKWFLLHRQAQELTSEQRFSVVVDSVIAGSLSPPRTRPDRAAKEAASEPSKAIRGRRIWAMWPAVALALAAVFLLVVALPQSAVDRPVARDTAKDQLPNAIAAVTSVSGAEWAQGRSLGVGSSLRQGDRVGLSSGIIKLTYNCGAEVLLQGPCEFVVVDAMQGKLCRGKLTVDVPPRAFGFGVVCPKTDIIDLGTAFGVAVDENGETDLQVFDGEVMCAAADFNAQQSPDYQHVRADETIRFLRRSHPGEAVDTPDDKFKVLRHHRLSRIADEEEASLGELALWLTAQHGIELDVEGRVAAWADRLTTTNLAGEDVVQPDEAARPRLVNSAIGGKPAVRFDGKTDYLVTTPLATTDEQTIALVVAFGEPTYQEGRQWGAQVLNYDGPPSREAAGVVMPGVIQIGESLREREFAPGRPNALAFAGFVGATAVESGRVDAPDSLGLQEPAVLLYRYSQSEQSATLWVNGEQVASTRAVAPVAIVSRKIIGRHAWKGLHFAGDLAELRIYNEALGAREMERLSEELSQQYGIAMAGGDGR